MTIQALSARIFKLFFLIGGSQEQPKKRDGKTRLGKWTDVLQSVFSRISNKALL